MPEAGWDRERMERLRLADGRQFGPRTCGCVAMTAHLQRYAVGVVSSSTAWPLCPQCSGLGVDQRIPV